MNIVYYIYRKVVRWEGEFFYIFCFANTKKKRPYFLCAGIENVIV